VTYTLNGYFGCKFVAGKTGILLNNEMDDFSAKPGVANMFGLVQGKANAIAPGKRMLSSMCPIIVTRDDQLVGLFGSPGGPQIITSVLQVLINLINYGLPLEEAIAAGRFHHQCLPDSIYIESGKFDKKVLEELEGWGYAMIRQNFMGNVQAIWQDGSQWSLCSDNRRNGYPVGY
jgi:gamma-glutamyltranspeptidase/glutathione hydrolase